MTINASTAILAALCLVLACVSIALTFLLLRRRTQACEKQSHFTNFDRLTGLGNKAKLLADDAAITSLDSYALVSVHLNRFMELYNLFGPTVSDGLITSLSHALVTFAEDRDGIAYRVTFDHLVMLVRVKDKPAFLEILKCFLQKSEHMDINLAGTHYIYDFLLLYGVYFLSEENDKGIGLPNILVFLDRKVLHSTIKSAAQCAVLDGTDKPDWKMAQVLAQDAKASWEKHEFVPYYQPIFNIYTGKVVGSEILARWQHPTYGLLLPHQFVPILEHNGLIMDLDLYMIEEACKKIQYWL
ncbi:MAG: EAL domain-containing protein, partial [Angelakisella sp.]